MRTSMIALAIVLFGVPNVNAQSQSTIDKASAQGNSCMMMTDSMSTALGLSEEQAHLVKEADERCLKACEQVGYRTTGKVDEAAMRDRDGDLKKILTSEQYARWSTMCNTVKAEGWITAPANTWGNSKGGTSR